MNLQEEIAMVACELYEKSGCVKGRELENWLAAERIVLARHAGQEMEEPEEESVPGETEEMEAARSGGSFASPEMEEPETASDMEEIEIESPIVSGKRRFGIVGPAGSIIPPKRGATGGIAALKRKKEAPGKTAS